jgi:hypothetical protein
MFASVSVFMHLFRNVEYVPTFRINTTDGLIKLLRDTFKTYTAEFTFQFQRNKQKVEMCVRWGATLGSSNTTTQPTRQTSIITNALLTWHLCLCLPGHSDMNRNKCISYHENAYRVGCST